MIEVVLQTHAQVALMGRVADRTVEDDLIVGRIERIAPDYKSATIKLPAPTDKVREGDIFFVYMMMEEYLKQNRRMESEHKDRHIARVRVTSVEGDRVTTEIDHGTTSHKMKVGDRAVARAY